MIPMAAPDRMSPKRGPFSSMRYGLTMALGGSGAACPRPLGAFCAMTIDAAANAHIIMRIAFDISSSLLLTASGSANYWWPHLNRDIQGLAGFRLGQQPNGVSFHGRR